jgi:enoyl-CoA hydratase/3-hydroxyacyl-CoA dehydrogenase
MLDGFNFEPTGDTGPLGTANNVTKEHGITREESDALAIPYRKWPKAAAKFHAMISQSERLTVQEAAEIGIVKKIVKTFPELIDAAIAEVNALQGNISRIPDGPVDIPEYKIPDAPMAGELPLSK